MPRLTLWGMLQWDTTLLDGIVLPDGMDDSILKDLIVMKAGDLYPYYQVPDRIKTLTSQWFNRKLYNFNLMYKALTTSYEPLHNYDRTEHSIEKPDITRVETPDIHHKSEGGSSFDGNTSDNGIIDEDNELSQSSTTNGDTKENVSAFDASDYSPRSQTVVDNSSSDHQQGNNIRVVENSGKSNVVNYNFDESSESGTRTHTEKGNIEKELRAYGNIGVTTSQQMLQSELDLRIYDLYEVIATMWIEDFIVTIY